MNLVNVSNWFINARVRLWKPMVEEMYFEETKEQQHNNNINVASSDDNNNGRIPDQTHPDDRKPTPNQVVQIDSECLSSIINNNPEKNDTNHTKNPPNQPPHHPHHIGLLNLQPPGWWWWWWWWCDFDVGIAAARWGWGELSVLAAISKLSFLW
ncbi:hypothetical protein CsSME_00045022 [Camellia sinensis var. sinensis]